MFFVLSSVFTWGSVLAREKQSLVNKLLRQTFLNLAELFGHCAKHIFWNCSHNFCMCFRVIKDHATEHNQANYIWKWFNPIFIIFPFTCLCYSGCGVIGYERAAQETLSWWRVWLSWCEVEPAGPRRCIPAAHRSMWAPDLCASTNLVSHIITITITSAAPVLPPAAAPLYSAPSAPHLPGMSTVSDACAATHPQASRGLRLCAACILIHRRAAVATRPAPKLAVVSPSAPTSWADSLSTSHVYTL